MTLAIGDKGEERLVSVCVCVCVCERSYVYVCVCVCVCACERKREWEGGHSLPSHGDNGCPTQTGRQVEITHVRCKNVKGSF